jgi:hypothetical protein
MKRLTSETSRHVRSLVRADRRFGQALYFLHPLKIDKIFSHVGLTLDRVLGWILDLLNTYTHDSELQATTAPSLITTASAKSFPASCVFTSRSLATASNSGDFSASRAEILSERRLPSNCVFSSQTPVQN